MGCQPEYLCMPTGNMTVNVTKYFRRPIRAKGNVSEIQTAEEHISV